MNFITNISTGQQTDKELITAYKDTGDLHHLGMLYQRYMDLVFGVCLKYFKDTERGKDATMDIFEELGKKLKVHEVDNFKGWLHVLARNYCLMQLRSPKHLKTSEFDAGFMQSEVPMHPAESVIDNEESFLLMEGCLKTLPAAQKQTIDLFYLQKKCYHEIAAITGYEWSKVRSFIQNGKRNLKLCMEAKQATNK